MIMMKRLIASWAWLLFAMGVTVGCYLSGLHSGFMFDDRTNITSNTYVQINSLSVTSLWQAAMSSSAGMLKRPVSMLSFALDYWWAGPDAYHFKKINLAIHLINGFFVYIFTKLLLDLYRKTQRVSIDEAAIQWAAVSAAAIWLLHPINLTSVLYVVQRMATLAALFTFGGLVVYLYGRKKMLERAPSGFAIIFVAFFVLTPLAALSKENGILLPAFMFAIELFILRWAAPTVVSSRFLKAIFAMTVVLPALVAIFYVLFNPTFILGSYQIRGFSLAERLMTEARALWFYLRLIVAPDITAMGFHHDDFQISHSLLEPPITFFAILGWFVLATGLITLRKRLPLITYGIVFFLVGHLLESTFFALELVYEHRNYLPSVGVAIAFSTGITSANYHQASLRWRRWGLVAFVMVLAGLTFIRASHWSNSLEFSLMEVRHHPSSVRAHIDLASTLVTLRSQTLEQSKANLEQAMLHYRQATSLSRIDASGLFGSIGVAWERGFSVDSSEIDELARRLEFVPFAPSSANSLMAFENCQGTRRCYENPELMEKLLLAALRNPTLRGREKAIVLFSYSDFLSFSKHQKDEAIKVARLALEESPNTMDHRFTLVKILMNQGQLDEAAEELEKTREVENAAVYTPAIDALAQTLKTVKAQRSSQKR